MNRDMFFAEYILGEMEFLEGQFPKNGKEELINNPVLQRATLRSLEIVSDGVKYLSKNFKSNNLQINWNDIEEMGSSTIHQYSVIDWDKVYEIILYALPELKEAIIRV